MIKSKIVEAIPVSQQRLVAKIEEHGDDYLWTALKSPLKQYAKTHQRILNAYTDEKIFSVSLAGAVSLFWYCVKHLLLTASKVLRQCSFVTKMHNLKWSDPASFASQEDQVALQHAIARYHAFLDLIQSSPGAFFVPTLDIDLAWHTHQLLGVPYERDCRVYINRFVDQ